MFLCPNATLLPLYDSKSRVKEHPGEGAGQHTITSKTKRLILHVTPRRKITLVHNYSSWTQWEKIKTESSRSLFFFNISVGKVKYTCIRLFEFPGTKLTFQALNQGKKSSQSETN